MPGTQGTPRPDQCADLQRTNLAAGTQPRNPAPATGLPGYAAGGPGMPVKPTYPQGFATAAAAWPNPPGARAHNAPLLFGARSC